MAPFIDFVQGNVPNFKLIEEKVRKSVAISMSLAIKDTVVQLKQHTREQFTTRVNWMDNRGIGIIGTRSIDPNNLQGQISTKAGFMVDHETSAVRRPEGRFFAAPTDYLKSIVGADKVIPKQYRPKQLLKNTKRKQAGKHQSKAFQTETSAYFINTSKFTGLTGIFVRRPNGEKYQSHSNKRMKHRRIHMLYVFIPSARIKGKFKFKETGTNDYVFNFRRIHSKIFQKMFKS